MLVRGSVDVVTATEVRGWAFALDRKEPVLVQAILNHEIVGEALANVHRPDLAAAKLGDGNSGFLIKLFRPIDPLYLPFVSVKIDRGDAELPRAPLLGFAEFFSTIYRTHPAAGRSRSVFGGLWTDRTDAAALLRGKMEIGQIAAAASAGITDLIQSGLHVAEAKPPAAGAKATLAEQLGAVMEDAGLLALLRAVLEDNPVVAKAQEVREDSPTFVQPSGGNPSPSPAECLALVLPVGGDVALDVVRDSHRLPEFTPQGVSRWTSPDATAAVTVARATGLVNRYELAAGTVAVVGAGTLYRIIGPAYRALCLPGRTVPLALVADKTVAEVARPNGVRMLLPAQQASRPLVTA